VCAMGRTGTGSRVAGSAREKQFRRERAVTVVAVAATWVAARNAVPSGVGAGAATAPGSRVRSGAIPKVRPDPDVAADDACGAGGQL
jgi:hypothetical protein